MRGAGPEPRAAAASFWASGWLWVGIALIVAAGFGYPAVAGLSAALRHRGNGRGDPVLGPADRCLPGPGIPELAEARTLRRITHVLASVLALRYRDGRRGASRSRSASARRPGTAFRPPSASSWRRWRREWDKLDAQRKQKWLGIAQRYPKMSVEEQARVRQQMGTWAQLSPAERQAAREQYKSLRALPPEKKQEVRQQWEQYQSLPPEKRRELATRPPPATAPAAPRGVRPASPPPPPPPPARPVRAATKVG